MTTVPPRKTSMKLRNYGAPILFRNTLKFVENERVTIADRDYGLMRVTAASGTPHPRVITGVSMTTLKERLEEVQENDLISKEVASELEIDSRFKPNAEMARKIRLTHTPHPTRGLNLNPKKIISHYIRSSKSDISERGRHPEMVLHPDRYSIRHSLAPKKGPSIMKIAKETRFETGQQQGHKKKVTLIAPKKESANNYIFPGVVDKDPSSSLSSSSSGSYTNQLLSFSERRRIFNEGEYTIAKNGNKLSDNIMPIPVKPINLDDYVDGDAERAKAEIDTFVRKQGYVMTPTGTLTNLRRFSSQMSKRSLPPSKRQSISSSDEAIGTQSN